MKGSKPARARNYVWTLNFGENEPFQIDPEVDGWGEKGVKYCVWQLEVGESGNLHFQGYIELSQSQPMSWMHNQLPGMSSASFASRAGTAAQADAYCRKAESRVDGPWSYGVLSQQGKSPGVLAIKAMLDEGKRMREVAEAHFELFLRHERALKVYKRQVTRPRDFKTRTFLFIGPPGVGKSTIMTLLAAKIGSVYRAPAAKGSGAYFDDYDGQDVVILDEFGGSSMKPEQFNMIADEHECVLPVHGGAGTQMTSKFLFIGTNYAPKFWWRGRSPLQIRQTTRRIDVVFKMGFLKNSNLARAPFFEPRGAADVPGSLASGGEVVAPAVNGSLISYTEFLCQQGIKF